MSRGGLWVVGAGFVLFSIAGCGGPVTPDTEGQTLTQARQALSDAGVPEGNITVTGPSGDPNSLIVCDHDPDGVNPSEPVTLEVATVCTDDDDKKKKKKPSSKKR